MAMSTTLPDSKKRVAIGVARAIQPALRTAEAERTSRRDRGDLTAWDLTMRGLPRAL